MSSKYKLPPELDISEDEDFNKDRLDRAFDYLLRRFLPLDSFRPAYEEQIDILRQIGLQRLNEALTPVYQDLVKIASLGAMFTATSSTQNTLGTGQKTFVITEGERGRFATAGYLIAKNSSDSYKSISGYLQRYDRDTGELVVLCDRFVGVSGEIIDDWTIAVSAPPNLTLTPGEIGAYTRGEIDGKLFTLRADLETDIDAKADSEKSASFINATLTRAIIRNFPDFFLGSIGNLPGLNLATGVFLRWHSTDSTLRFYVGGVEWLRLGEGGLVVLSSPVQTDARNGTASSSHANFGTVSSLPAHTSTPDTAPVPSSGGVTFHIHFTATSKDCIAYSQTVPFHASGSECYVYHQIEIFDLTGNISIASSSLAHCFSHSLQNNMPMLNAHLSVNTLVPGRRYRLRFKAWKNSNNGGSVGLQDSSLGVACVS